LERPAKAISSRSDRGHAARAGAELTNLAMSRISQS
jgi:hypothetical protein